MKYVLYKVKKNLVGRTTITIKTSSKFDINDVFFVCNDDYFVKSRWRLIKIKDSKITLKKEPHSAINLDCSKHLSGKYENKVNILSSEDAELLNKYFMHDIIIKPSYDREYDDEILNSIIEQLRKKDYEIELYANNLTDNTTVRINHCFKGIYNLIIKKDYGLICFKTVTKDLFDKEEYFNDFMEDATAVDEVYNTLLGSSFLTEDGINLNIGYHKYYVFEDDVEDERCVQLNNIMMKLNYHAQSFIRASDFVNSLSFSNNEQIVDESKRFGIMQMLMPQYINSRMVNVNTNSTLKFINDDFFELDENQKNILEEMNERVYLKASAGSGKTILLLAKAYSMATSNPDKRFLIICYNNKLCDDIKRQAVNTGKYRNNLLIYTLDKFIEEERISTYTDTDEKKMFYMRKKHFVDAVENGRYNKKFGGIFVDEMQQMKDEWKLALFNCLDESKYMILAGDYYQQIRPSDDGDVDDEIIEEDEKSDDYYLGEHRFKQIVLDINYRNTKEISRVVNKMIKRIGEYRDLLNILVPYEERDIVYGKAYKSVGINPEYYNVSNDAETLHKVLQIIENLINNKGYTQNDILLVLPWKGYNIVPKIKNALKVRQLSYCDFSESSLSTNGIRIGTIGRAIGLDFKAVIIFNTSAMKKSRIDSSFKFTRLGDIQDADQKTKEEFIEFLKNIYVACSRARESLYVIDDIPTRTSNNIISQFLKIVGDSNE